MINPQLQKEKSDPQNENHADPSMMIYFDHLTLAINNVTLLGRVGADPQRKGSDEHPIAVFSLATHTNYRYESGEFLQRTEWHRVICFKPGLRESVLNFLKKGQRVHVSGRITYGEIKGEDGAARSTTAIAAEDVIFFQSQ